jgi:hypothetical protein
MTAIDPPEDCASGSLPGANPPGAFLTASPQAGQALGLGDPGHGLVPSSAGVRVAGLAPPMCGRCFVAMRTSAYTVQTVNRLRPGQTVGTVSPSGPGALGKCWKCPECGHSRH